MTDDTLNTVSGGGDGDYCRYCGDNYTGYHCNLCGAHMCADCVPGEICPECHPEYFPTDSED